LYYFIIWFLRNLQSCHANVRGVLAGGSDGLLRIEMLSNLCLTDYNLDVLALSETHLSSDIDDRVVKISGFEIFRNDRKVNGRQGGGVMLYVRRELNPIRITNLEKPEVESLYVQTKLHGKTLIFFVVYRPPNQNCRARDLFLET